MHPCPQSCFGSTVLATIPPVAAAPRTAGPLLTKGDAQVAWHHTEVDQLCRHPDGPQRLAVVPQLLPILVVDGRGGAALHIALQAIEDREVEEGMAAAGGGVGGKAATRGFSGNNQSEQASRDEQGQASQQRPWLLLNDTPLTAQCVWWCVPSGLHERERCSRPPAPPTVWALTVWPGR
jgi:hypothetical protein